MMNKKSFVTIIDGIRDYWDSMLKLESALNIQIDENFMTKIIDNVLNAVSDDMEENIDKDDEIGTWVSYYAFELDFGRVDYAADSVKIDSVAHPLTNAEELYDLLIALNKID